MNKPTDDSKQPEPLPRAVVTMNHFSWLVWGVPLAAAAFAVWLVYKDVVATGPKLTIYFKNADGIDPGNTQVKCRGAPVGKVKQMKLTSSNQWVAVKVTLNKDAADVAREGSLFWVVQPQMAVARSKVCKQSCLAAMSTCGQVQARGRTRSSVLQDHRQLKNLVRYLTLCCWRRI